MITNIKKLKLGLILKKKINQKEKEGVNERESNWLNEGWWTQYTDETWLAKNIYLFGNGKIKDKGINEEENKT